jgi:hypothetical protein
VDPTLVEIIDLVRRIEAGATADVESFRSEWPEPHREHFLHPLWEDLVGAVGRMPAGGGPHGVNLERWRDSVDRELVSFHLHSLTAFAQPTRPSDAQHLRRQA